jgi:hypothetical protein
LRGYNLHRLARSGCRNNSCEGRSEAPILVYDRSGKLLRSFGQGLFNFPHGGTVDRDGNLWMTDARGADGIGHHAGTPCQEVVEDRWPTKAWIG